MLFGALKPVNDVLGGIRLQTSVWGQPVPIVFGRNRLSGNLLWYGDFIAKSVTNSKKGGSSSGSGKKGSGQYDYGAAVAIALCRGPIANLGSIWSTQGLLPINDTEESYTVPSGGGSYTVTQVNTFLQDLGCQRADSYSVGANDYGSPGPVTITGTTETPMTEVGGSPGAGQYSQSGGVYTFSGADAGKNITINYTYAPPITAGGFSEDPITSIGFTLFNGAQGQSPWGYLTSKHPSQALGYSLIAYAATPLLDLGMAGVLPNFSYEIIGNVAAGHGNGQGDVLPGDVLAFMFSDSIDGAGILSGELAALTAYNNYCGANGLYVSPVYDDQGTLADRVKDLLEATNSELVESDWLLKVVPYGDTTLVGNGFTFSPATQPQYDLTMDDLIRKGSLPAVQCTIKSIQDAYNAIQVTFSDRANSYNTSLIQAQDLDAIQTYKYRPDSRDYAKLFASSGPAIAAAQTILSRSVYILRKFTIVAANQYILPDPMDVITVPDPATGTTQIPVRILSVTEQPNGDLEMECEDFPWGCNGPTLYPKQAGSSSLPNVNVSPGSVNPPVIFEALSRQNNQAGHALYFGLSGGANWGGSRVHVSVDGGSSYQPIGTWAAKATMGTLTAALPSSSDPDTTDTLAVDLTESEGALSSFSAADANAFASLCYVDDGGSAPFELVGYETASLTAACKYNLGTLLRRGCFNTPIGSHPIGSNFLFLDQTIFGWLYDPTLIGKTLYFKFTSINTSGLMEENIANVTAYPFTPTGAQLGLLMPAHATYAPTSNPLTAVDAGSSATIDIAAFNMRVPGVPDIAEGSGSIISLAYNTLYYVFFDDPGFAGGAVVYQASTSKIAALQGAGRFFVGSILTPVAGGTPTSGNGDGGAGAQTGLVFTVGMNASVPSSANFGNGAVANPGNAIDGNPTTYCAITVAGNGANNGATLIVSGAAGLSARYSSATLYVRAAVPTNSINPHSGLSLQAITASSGVPGSPTAALEAVLLTIPEYNSPNQPIGIQTYSVALPLGLNLGAIFVSCGLSIGTWATGGSQELDIYDVWIEAIS